jgi:PAS domain S-box-containing protein
LVKPFSAKELLARVGSTLQMAQLRKQAAQREQMLRTEAETARDQVHNILESITDAFVAFDRDWRYTYVNQAAVRLLGRSADELVGKNVWQEVFPSEVGGLAYTKLHQAVTEQIPVSWEEFGKPIQRWLEVNAYPSMDGIAVYFRDISDRKQTEAALQQSEERLRVALKNSPITVFNQDQNLRYTWIYNPAFDFQVTDVIGRHDVDLIASEDAAVLTQLKQQVLATATGIREEVKISRPDGEYYYDLTIEPLQDAHNKVVGITCAAIDITNHKRTEMALRESEERLHSFVVANVIGILFGDVYGGIHEANDEFLRIVGYTREDLQAGQVRWIEMTPPEYLPLDEERVAEARARGACTPYEKEYIRKDGSRVPVLLGYGLVGAKREESVAFILDLTESKQAESALRQSEERYRYLAELIPQLVWTANAEGVLLDVNQRWLDFTGLTLAQAQQQGWQAVIHPDDVPVLSQNWAVAQHNGSYYQAEGRMRRADGGYRWHLHQAVPQKDDRGQVIKWFGTATDIEEQKQLQQERDRSLRQEQAAREEAEVANRIKDEFLAVLSHELRSPLNPILGWAKLLQAGKLDRQATQRGLETIERNAKLQTQLIEDLLDVSRILRGKMALTVTPVDLATVIDAAIETVRLSAEAKHIHIHKNIAPNVGQISGDAGRLQQVVWNLLSNAIKFTPAGGRVEVRLEQVEWKQGSLEAWERPSPPQPPYAQITVTDTGKGISPDFLPYVFDYFRQEDGKITRKFGGLGLGLAIVRHITELHGGTVRVESAGEGQGATFTVQFPLMPEDGDRSDSLATPDPSAVPTSSEAFNSRPLAGVQVLVVDDEADMRELTIFVLEQSGARVQAVASAAEALAALDTFQPDVLISDIGMPEMDGYTLMQQVQERSRQANQPTLTIALTAYASEYDQQQALQAGFQQHIAKPIAPNELVEAVVSLLKQLSDR